MRPNDELVVPAAAAAGINTLPPGLSGARWWMVAPSSKSGK
jgi:hypothetical protein